MDFSRERAVRSLQRYGSSIGAWRLTLGAVFAAEALILVWVGRHQWYFFDEWRLIVERVITLPLAVFVVLTRHGNAVRTRTPTDSYASTCPRAPTWRHTPLLTFNRSNAASTTDHAKHSAT